MFAAKLDKGNEKKDCHPAFLRLYATKHTYISPSTYSSPHSTATFGSRLHRFQWLLYNIKITVRRRSRRSWLKEMANVGVSMGMWIISSTNAFKTTNIYINGVQEGGKTHSKLNYSYFRAYFHPPHCQPPPNWRLLSSPSLLTAVHSSQSPLLPFLNINGPLSDITC